MTRPTFITLGPAGTCHENAVRHYLAFQDVGDFDLVLVDDLLGAIGRVREQPNTFLVQCSAHLQVHLVTERHHEDVFVVDTFIYPTKELGLIFRNDIDEHRSIGIVSATRGYLDLSRFETIIDQPSKPVVARNLLAGEFDAGLTHVHYAEDSPQRLRLVEYYGAVDTTWVVYGARKRFAGAVIGQRAPWLFCDEPHPHSSASRQLDATTEHLTAPRRAHALSTFFGRRRASWTTRTSCRPSERAHDCGG